MPKDNRAVLKLDRRSPKRRRILITLPPLPQGGEIEIIQGHNRKADDVAYAPPGTTVSRPK